MGRVSLIIRGTFCWNFVPGGSRRARGRDCNFERFHLIVEQLGGHFLVMVEAVRIESCERMTDAHFGGWTTIPWRTCCNRTFMTGAFHS